jgi:hypothetical protein
MPQGARSNCPTVEDAMAASNHTDIFRLIRIKRAFAIYGFFSRLNLHVLLFPEQPHANPDI